MLGSFEKSPDVAFVAWLTVVLLSVLQSQFGTVRATEPTVEVNYDSEPNKFDQIDAKLVDAKVDGSLEAAEAADRIRNLLYWDRYKTFYHKHYNSTSEALVRLKIFIGHSMVVVAKLIQYQTGKSSYYLTLNQFSDQTKAELVQHYSASLSDIEPTLKVATGEFANSRLRRRRDTGNSKPKSESNSAKKTKQTNIFGRILASMVGKSKVNDANHGRPKMLLDWRATGCLNPPIDQGDCACCYAMTTLKLLEWHHCRQNLPAAKMDDDKGQPKSERGQSVVKFSEQFLVDCGTKMGLGGCHSGSLEKTLKFVQQYGIALSRDWPYMAQQQQCPVQLTEENNEAPGVTGGSNIELVKVQNSSFKRLQRSEWQAALEEQPLIVYLAIPERFFDYGGGVFEGVKCDPQNGHFMLLVGHGIEAGRPFWLLANSFGPDYGVEGGYLRLSRRNDSCMAYVAKVGASFST